MGNSLYKKMEAFAPAVISGVLTFLSFPSYNFSFLAWFALMPLLVSLWGKSPRQAFFMGYLFGITYFFGSLYWIYHSICYYGNISFPASIAIVILLCLYLGLYPALFSFVFSRVITKTKIPAVVAAPVFWVVLEFLRSYALTGFPWASIGYSQHAMLPIIQISDITGVYGISFLVLSCNGALSDFILLRGKVREMPLYPFSYTIIGSITLLALILISLGYGFWRLSEERPGRQVSVGIIQGNIEQDRKWDAAYQEEVLNTYLSLSTESAVDSPDMIVWPETALPFLFGSDIKNTDRLLTSQRQFNSHLLFGSVLSRGEKEGKPLLANSAVLLDQEGKTVYSYDKIHLVPFGEYVPMRNILFFLDKLVEGVGDYVPGKNYVRAETPFGGFATFICYEIIFPGMVRKFFATGGDMIVTITNDAWFGWTPGPYQHFSMAVFRAIENRKPVVRAANTGISGIIDSSGRVLARTGLFERVYLAKSVRTDRSHTFYTKFGDIFSYMCIVTTILLLLNRKLWR